jgi:hypothetical protein
LAIDDSTDTSQGRSSAAVATQPIVAAKSVSPVVTDLGGRCIDAAAPEKAIRVS